MVEYAVLLAGNSLSAIGTFAGSAELWLSRINWELVALVVLGLVVLRIAAWVLKLR